MKNMTESWRDGLHRYRHLPENEQVYMERMDTWFECIGKLLLLGIFVATTIIWITGWGVME